MTYEELRTEIIRLLSAWAASDSTNVSDLADKIMKLVDEEWHIE